MRQVRYLIVTWCMFGMDKLIDGIHTCRISSFLILFVGMVPLTPTTRALQGLTFHPCTRICLINGLYYFLLVWMGWLMYLSCI
jgi:hypothetical protein